jgi:hypothetical protein
VKILFEEQEQVAAAAKDNLVTLQEPVWYLFCYYNKVFM